MHLMITKGTVYQSLGPMPEKDCYFIKSSMPF